MILVLLSLAHWLGLREWYQSRMFELPSVVQGEMKVAFAFVQKSVWLIAKNFERLTSRLRALYHCLFNCSPHSQNAVAPRFIDPDTVSPAPPPTEQHSPPPATFHADQPGATPAPISCADTSAPSQWPIWSAGTAIVQQ